MDTFLANYFGTNKAPEPTTGTDDLEKMAQLVMLDKIAEAKNIDLSSLSDAEYVKLANQVFNGEQAQQQQAPPAQPTDGLTEHEKVAAARLEEAKFLGQVVAHSMWNELESIQKHAMAKTAGEPPPQFQKGNGEDEEEKKDEEKKDEEEGMTKEEKCKTGSALDALSDARAYEILQGYGLADGEGNVVSAEALNKHAEAVYAQQQEQAQPTEKTAADRLAEAVEEQAWQKLASAGYDPRVINYLLQVNQGQ